MDANPTRRLRLKSGIPHDLYGHLRKLLSSQAKWCQGHEAVNGDGDFAACTNGRAVRYSFDGALFRAVMMSLRGPCKKARAVPLYLAIMGRARTILGENPMDFNDDPRTTYEDVRGLVEAL